MSIDIGDITFDRVRYDEAADVLYLHRGEASDAVEFDASPEGHALRFDAHGRLVGVTIVRPRWHLEHEEGITITIPERVHLSKQTLAGALTG
jgi:uncharacterized protein YuzE